MGKRGPKPGQILLDVAEHHRRMRAYFQTDSDIEAAQFLGISRETFRAWRKSFTLPAKRTAHWPPNANDGKEPNISAMLCPNQCCHRLYTRMFHCAICHHDHIADEFLEYAKWLRDGDVNIPELKVA